MGKKVVRKPKGPQALQGETAVKKEKNLGGYVRKNEHCILMGTAGTLLATPWDLPDHDYIGCAPVITHKVTEGHRIDLLFELHPMEYWTNKAVLERMNKCNIPMFMQEQFAAVPKSLKFPIKEIQAEFDHPKLKNYFTSSITYMIAFAIYAGYKSIDLYGIHMSSSEEEYSIQRNSCEAWLAFAFGKGVNFWLPDESSLFRNGCLYGYEQKDHLLLELINRKNGLKTAETELSKRLETAKQNFWMQKGAVASFDQYIKEKK